MSKIYENLNVDASGESDLSRIASELASSAEDRAADIARIKESLHAEQIALDAREKGLGARERELEEQCRQLETATRDSATHLKALRAALDNEKLERTRIEIRESEAVEKLQRQVTELEEEHVVTIDELRDTLNRTKQELAELLEDRARIERQAATSTTDFEARIERSRAETMEAAIQLELMQSSIAETHTERAKAERRLAEMDGTLNKQIDETKRHAAVLEQERATLREELDAARQQIEGGKRSEATMKAQLASMEQDAIAAREQREKLQAEQKANAERYGEQHTQSSEQLKTLRQELAELRTHLATAESGSAKLERILEERAVEMQRASDGHKTHVDKLEESLEQAVQLRQDVETDAKSTGQELNMRIRELETELLDANTQLNAIRHDAESSKAELANAQALIDEHSKAADLELATLKATLEAERDDAREQLVQVIQEKGQADTQNAELKQGLADAKQEKNNADAQIEDLNQQLDRARDDSMQARSVATPTPAPGTDIQNEDSWYLKLDDGSQFGPVAFKKLFDWATEGRIGPEHEISEDGGAWFQAKEIEGLHMHWKVELVNGTTYGPINLSAVRYLMEDGSVARSATIEHAKSGDKLRALHMLTPEVQEMYDTIKEQAQMLDSLSHELDRQRQLTAQLESAVTKRDPSDPISGAPPKLVRNRILNKDN